jgi:putative addiction module component (TIGR02574 family)
MTKHQMTDLHKLSLKDKLKIVQALWDDIAKEQTIDSLPTEHKQILDQRINLINSGNAQFTSWADVQIKYQSLV